MDRRSIIGTFACFVVLAVSFWVVDQYNLISKLGLGFFNKSKNVASKGTLVIKKRKVYYSGDTGKIEICRTNLRLGRINEKTVIA